MREVFFDRQRGRRLNKELPEAADSAEADTEEAWRGEESEGDFSCQEE